MWWSWWSSIFLELSVSWFSSAGAAGWSHRNQHALCLLLAWQLTLPSRAPPGAGLSVSHVLDVLMKVKEGSFTLSCLFNPLSWFSYKTNIRQNPKQNLKTESGYFGMNQMEVVHHKWVRTAYQGVACYPLAIERFIMLISLSPQLHSQQTSN